MRPLLPRTRQVEQTKQTVVGYSNAEREYRSSHFVSKMDGDGRVLIYANGMGWNLDVRSEYSHGTGTEGERGEKEGES